MGNLKRILGERMIKFVEYDELQRRCPWVKYYHAGNAHYGNFIPDAPYDDNFRGSIHSKKPGNYGTMCRMCRDFIDLNPSSILCPCHTKRTKAILRAKNAVRRWRHGKHKWQLEGE